MRWRARRDRSRSTSDCCREPSTGEVSRRRFERGDFPPARPAATLLAIYPDADGDLVIPLTVRHGDLRAHAGEVSLPGGAVDATDAGPEAAALREAWEEVGLRSDDVRIVGTLDPVWIPVSNFELIPFVGTLSSRPDARATRRGGHGDRRAAACRAVGPGRHRRRGDRRARADAARRSLSIQRRRGVGSHRPHTWDAGPRPRGVGRFNAGSGPTSSARGAPPAMRRAGRGEPPPRWHARR